MYSIVQSKIEIQLISENDEVITYEDYDVFIECVGYYFINKYVVNTFKEWLDDWLSFYPLQEKRVRYIVRDKFGSMFTKTELLNDIYELNYRKRTSNKLCYKFRYDPIPHTGRRRWRFGCWYKKPCTTQEKRWNIAHFKYVRGKRHPKYLATSWDDYVRSDVRTRRSWKKIKKKKQWM